MLLLVLLLLLPTKRRNQIRIPCYDDLMKGHETTLRGRQLLCKASCGRSAATFSPKSERGSCKRAAPWTLCDRGWCCLSSSRWKALSEGVGCCARLKVAIMPMVHTAANTSQPLLVIAVMLSTSGWLCHRITDPSLLYQALLLISGQQCWQSGRARTHVFQSVKGQSFLL